MTAAKYLWRHRRAVLCGAAALIALCLCYWAGSPREPVYQRRGLASWLRQMNEGDTDQRLEAVAAIRAMGNRVLPHLIARLAPRDGRQREFLRWLDRHTPSMRAGLPDRHIS